MKISRPFVIIAAVLSIFAAGFTPSNVPLHVPTWDDNVTGMAYTAQQIAPYTDFMESTQGSKQLVFTESAHAAGIKTVVYTDPNRQRADCPAYQFCPENSSDESLYAHDCNNNRPTFTKPLPHSPMWLMDVNNPLLVELWKSDIAYLQGRGGVFDYIFDDTADSVASFATPPCNFNQAEWDAASNIMNRALGEHIIFNGLSATKGGGNSPSAVAILPSTDGGMAEACYIGYNPNNRKMTGREWVNTEKTELLTESEGKYYVCHDPDNEQGDTPQAIDQRMYQYASYLLTSDLHYALYSSNYDTPTHFHIYPEVFLVPLHPKTDVTDISELLQPGGTYGREYTCYYKRVSLGPCAIVVNPTGSPAPFPFTGYGHTMVLHGSGILDGGTATFDGPAPSTVGAGEGVVAIP